MLPVLQLLEGGGQTAVKQRGERRRAEKTTTKAALHGFLDRIRGGGAARDLSFADEERLAANFLRMREFL
ncbi:hypothetical protein cyc_07882 [Cyclospora cayetanensis]|uniref:Uncharacterized protein n=1 Tax=Cyclospora cayetanensis TaxID=88456 RepID=A0A1D3D6I1_9EIME|nr:hypothetical protein cyc_07882 [Cyclospora cayetanensis]